jgi:hypothetical protein
MRGTEGDQIIEQENEESDYDQVSSPQNNEELKQS